LSRDKASSEGSPSIEFLIESAMDLVNHTILRKAETVVSVEESKDGWHVVVEALERKCIPDSQDLLSRYQLNFSVKGKILGWKQILVRKRLDHYSV
jgi:hypothetical protein